MGEIAKVNDVAWADIAEVGGVAKADIAKIGASADAPSGGGVVANTHCVDFGGGYLEAATWADFSFNGNVIGEFISFSLWVNLSTTGGHQTLISKFGGVDGYVLAIYNNELSFSIWDQPVSSNDGLWYQTATAGTPLALDTGRWQHIVAIFDDIRASPVGLARIYIDGQDTNAVVNATYDRFLGNAFTYTKFRLGSRGAGTGAFPFSGKMDEVSIWSKALTTGEVAAIHTAGVVTTTADLTGESGLESWYRFKSTDIYGGTAGGIVDELGNANLTSSPGGVSSAAV